MVTTAFEIGNYLITLISNKKYENLDNVETLRYFWDKTTKQMIITPNYRIK